jgi:hypothetical protein
MAGFSCGRASRCFALEKSKSFQRYLSLQRAVFACALARRAEFGCLTGSPSPRKAKGSFGPCRLVSSGFCKRPSRLALSISPRRCQSPSNGCDPIRSRSSNCVRETCAPCIMSRVEGDEVVVLIVGRKVGNKLIVEGEEFYGHQDDSAQPPRNRSEEDAR